MEQIEELQSRILSALERIGGGVAALEEKHANQPVPTLDELDMQKHASLLAEIDDEKMANAQLEERLKVLHARLAEMEKTVQAVKGGEDLLALHAKLAEQGAAPAPSGELTALRGEVARLKQDLENAQNQAATAREKLEDDLTEVVAQNDQLKAQLDEIATVTPDDTQPATDSGASDEELNTLRLELEALRQRAETAEAAAAAASAPSQADVPTDHGGSSELDQRLTELDRELQALRASNDQLRESNAALRAANADGIGDPSLINTGLVAEVEGLKAARATDQAEVNAVLARLEPLLATAPNLPEGEEA